MPDAERSRLFADLIDNRDWREDILDLITVTERRGESYPVDRCRILMDAMSTAEIKYPGTLKFRRRSATSYSPFSASRRPDYLSVAHGKG